MSSTLAEGWSTTLLFICNKMQNKWSMMMCYRHPWSIKSRPSFNVIMNITIIVKLTTSKGQSRQDTGHGTQQVRHKSNTKYVFVCNTWVDVVRCPWISVNLRIKLWFHWLVAMTVWATMPTTTPILPILPIPPILPILPILAILNLIKCNFKGIFYSILWHYD